MIFMNIIWLLRFILLISIVTINCLHTESNEPADPPNEANDQALVEYSGLVEKITMFEGTLSQYSYFVFIDEHVKQIILFNQNKKSRNFDDYVGLHVNIKGEMIIGTIGWSGQKKEGLLVKEIFIVEKE